MPILRDQMRVSGRSHALLAMKEDGIPETEKILNLTLEIIFLLTGEDFVLTKREDEHPSEGSMSPPEESPRPPSPIADLPHPPPTEEGNECKPVPDCTEDLRGAAEEVDVTGACSAEEIPVRCEDIPEYLSVEEWQYLKGHREHYMDEVKEMQRPLTTGESREEAPEESFGSALYSQSCPETRSGREDYQVEDGGGIIHCKEEEAEPDPVMTDDLSERNPPASCGGVPWTRLCAEEEGRTDTQDYQEEAIERIILCKEEEEDKSGDLATDLQRSQIDHNGCYQMFPSGHADEDAAAGPQITGNWQSKAPAAEWPQVTGLPEQHARAGCAPDPAMTSSGSNAGALQKREGIPAKAYKCGYCRRSYDNKIELMAHQRTHSAECPQSFKDNTALVTHQWTFHRQGPLPEHKPFSCKECGRSFTKKSALVKHQRLHTGAFACPDCGKCLSDRTGLILHRRTHTGEKPFTCSECGKRFTQMCHLVTHQSVHTGARPFTCAECGKCFSIRSVLDAHQALHARHKTWSCSECGKSFTQKAALVTHQRVHKKSTS